MKPDGPESAARHAATGAVKAPTAKRPPDTADRHFHGIESRLAAAEVTSTSFLAIRKSSDVYTRRGLSVQPGWMGSCQHYYHFATVV